jgi:hypothetical protein
MKCDLLKIIEAASYPSDRGAGTHVDPDFKSFSDGISPLWDNIDVEVTMVEDENDTRH